MTTVNGLRAASLGESLDALYKREVIGRPRASHRAILLRSLEPAPLAARLPGEHLEQRRLKAPPPLEREVELFI